jgi:mRNA interferase MazF
MRRFTRLTNAFSKKVENHCHALALYFVWYNVCRIHKSLRVTPAMAAGVSDTLRDMAWIAEMVEAAAPKPRAGRTGSGREQKPMKTEVKRGDIIVVDLEGAVGVEKKNDQTSGVRPCLVVQNDVGNKHSPMTIIVPLTDAGQFKGLPVQVEVSAAELGFAGSKDSVIECGHIRTIDGDARVRENLGRVDPMERVDAALAVSLGLRPSKPNSN